MGSQLWFDVGVNICSICRYLSLTHPNTTAMNRLRIFLTLCLLLAAPMMSRNAAAYWQQEVAYMIDVTLIDATHTITGDLSVVYTNNSPDTLHEVYFHLYNNAFQPGSMMDERSEALNNGLHERIAAMLPSEYGMYSIPAVLVDGEATPFEIKGTVLRVMLNKPLLPHQGLRLSLPQFEEQIPLQTRRNGWNSREGVEYSMAQWYPKVAEYDEEGWHHQAYVAREFYGVWGTFDVTLRLPSRFTVGATGQVQNPNEVGHGYDAIAKGEKSGSVLPMPTSGMTTWHWKAENVHDFAWVADSTYVHEWATWRDTITVHALYKTSVANFWRKNAIDYAIKSLTIYSNRFTTYPYHNFYTTHAGDGGMEYPQLIMLTGYRPGLSLAGVTAHEVGHQWFYGLLGSNETRQAFMDEGFTQFATMEAMGEMYGDTQRDPNAPRSWLNWFYPDFSNRRDNYKSYLSLAIDGYEEPLAIPHDWFREDINAGQVYGKTLAILSMLRYTLGDSLFWQGMKDYAESWKFRHPHLLDFQRVMEKTASTDLDWFFDEWFSTTRTIDYAARGVSSDAVSGGYNTTLNVANLDDGVMSVDVMLHYTDGTTQDATIPLATNKNDGFRKPDTGRIFFPSWDWTAREYSGSAVTPKAVSWFEIDTSLRLQDLRRLNNYSPLFFDFTGRKVQFALWKQLDKNPPLDKQYSILRPIAWYSEHSGLSLGVGSKFGWYEQYSGDVSIDYNFNAPPMQRSLHRDPGFDSNSFYKGLGFDYNSRLRFPLLGRLSWLTSHAQLREGIATAAIGLEHTVRPDYLYLGPTLILHGALQYQWLYNENFPFYRKLWSPGQLWIASGGYKFLSHQREWKFNGDAETSFANSDQTFSRLFGELIYEPHVANWIQPKVRAMGGTSFGDLPIERCYYLSMASPITEQQSGFYRAVSGLSSGFAHSTDLFINGGAGVRGYSDSSGSLAGRQIWGGNIDLLFSGPIAFARALLDLRLFADAGWLDQGGSRRTTNKHVMADAGIGIDFHILNLLPWQLRGVAEEYAAIPTLSISYPLYLSEEGWKKQLRLSLGSTF